MLYKFISPLMGDATPSLDCGGSVHCMFVLIRNRHGDNDIWHHSDLDNGTSTDNTIRAVLRIWIDALEICRIWPHALLPNPLKSQRSRRPPPWMRTVQQGILACVVLSARMLRHARGSQPHQTGPSKRVCHVGAAGHQFDRMFYTRERRRCSTSVDHIQLHQPTWPWR